VLGRKLDEADVGLMSVQEKIDTSSNGSRLVFHTFGALAEFERNLVESGGVETRLSTNPPARRRRPGG
jgi:DNA invertase Pin-like site-specific DNA recombinase